VSKVLQQRTCVGCGQRAPQTHLLRIVADPQGSLVPDPAHRAPGRGGYLHRDPACWEGFAKRKGPVRSLRRTASRTERQDLVARLRADSAL
jgi:predicted RNA-binding protein YlxR (DUF448 family)